MFTPTIIQECLFDRVKFRQTVNPDYPQLNDNLIEPNESGLYFEDAHALITIENIDSCAKNYAIFNFPVWDIATEYNTGDRVRFAGDNQVYQSLVDNNLGNQPDTNPAEWELVNLISLYLEGKVKDSISEIVSKMFTMKKLNRETKAIFQNTRLFDWTRSLKDKVIKKSRFVGFEIVPRRDVNLSVVIQKIGTDFDTVNPDLNIYIFHSSQFDPLFVIPVNHNKANSHVWTKVNTTLNYMNDNYDAGGSFYIGYYEDELEGQAIEKTNIDFAVGPRGCCQGTTTRLWNLWTKYLSVTPIVVDASNLNGKNLWDVDKTGQIWCTNFGLNLELSVKCDMSDLICNQADLFDFIIQKHTALKLIGELAYNTRQNFVSKKVQQEIEDINKNPEFTTALKDNNVLGLSMEVNQLLEGLDIDLSQLHTVCLPCKKKGSRYKAA